LRKLYFIIFCLIGMTVNLQIANAADTASGDKKPKKEKKQTLNFEDELVEGATNKPELFFLFQKKNFNYNRLIRLRENFIPEMKKTSEELQRGRREN
jgi:hypothetical protein